MPSVLVADEDPWKADRQAFYDLEHIPEIRLQIDQVQWERLQHALPKRIFVPARFEYGDIVLERVGVRFKGNSSSQPNLPFKRSFLIKFNEYTDAQRFLGMERVALDNGIQFGSLFSEPLLTSILRKRGVAAPRANHTRLYLNGRFHGIYVNVERIDESFIRHRWGVKDGALYKVDEGGPGADLAPVQHVVRAGHKLAFEPKSEAAHSDARDVVELIGRINETSDDEFEAMLAQSFVVDDLLQTMAVLLFGGAFDQLTGWNPHNYYLFRHPDSGRWHYLPWDLDVGFADRAFGRIPVIHGWNAAWPAGIGHPSPLMDRIVRDEDLLTRYREFATTILEEDFHPEVLIPRLEYLYERLEEDLGKDPFPHRRITNPTDRGYQDVVAAQKQFIRTRYRLARRQLEQPGERPRMEMPHRRPQEPRPGPDSPDAPSELKIVSVSPLSVVMEWKDNAQGEAGHILQRADESQDEPPRFRNVLGQPGQNVTRAEDRKIRAGASYRYRVFAVQPTPQGPRGTGVSNVVSVKVPAK